jgi:hypothetical protein
VGILEIIPNQSLDLTVKTPGELVNVLRTAGQAERSVLRTLKEETVNKDSPNTGRKQSELLTDIVETDQKFVLVPHRKKQN